MSCTRILGWVGRGGAGLILSRFAPSQQRVTWIGINLNSAIALPDDHFPQLLAHASVRLPHRLQGLPLHCAVPAQVSASVCGMAPLTAVLIWRHPIAGQPAIEIHTAVANLAKLQETISDWIS